MQVGAAFTQGKILKPLLTFTLPVLAALCLQAMYGAVDLAVVGWFGQASDVSAVSTGSQITQTVTGIITGLAMGATVRMGQLLGRGEGDAAGDVIGGAICLFSVVAVIATALAMALAEPLARLMNAPEAAFDGTVRYIRVCGAGELFIVAYNLLGGIFRGMGDSRTPLLAVGIACVCNVAGDLLLVAGLGMGTAGAALATVLSQGVSVAICLRVVARRGLPFPFSRKNIRFQRREIREILRLGAPMALQDALVSASFLVLLAIVNSLGLVISAGVGVAERLCGFIMLIPSAFMQSLSAFVAQNTGAGRDDRSRRAMALGMAASFLIGLVAAYLAFFHGETLAGLFAGSDQAVIAAAAEYLRAYAIDTLLVSFMFCFCGYFNGRGMTRFVLVNGLVGAFCVRIPVSYFMSRQSPVSLFHVGLATPASTVVQICLCGAFFWWIHRGSGREGRK